MPRIIDTIHKGLAAIDFLKALVAEGDKWFFINQKYQILDYYFLRLVRLLLDQ